MAALGNVGRTFRVGKKYSAWQFFTYDKQPTSVNMLFNGVNASEIPFSYAVLARNAVRQYQTRADGSGVFAFYDMDDSGSQVYSISTYTQSGPTGEAYTVIVVGNVVTITRQFTSNRTRSFTFG